MRRGSRSHEAGECSRGRTSVYNLPCLLEQHSDGPWCLCVQPSPLWQQAGSPRVRGAAWLRLRCCIWDAQQRLPTLHAATFYRCVDTFNTNLDASLQVDGGRQTLHSAHTPGGDKIRTRGPCCSFSRL